MRVDLFAPSLGLYGLYWFYQNWSLYRPYFSKPIWAIPRAVFSIFFTHSLFEEIDKHLKLNNKDYAWKPNIEATLYVVVTIIGNIANNMSQSNVLFPYTDIISLLYIFILLSPLVKAQQAINTLSDDPAGSSNSTYTVANFIWIALGVIWWGLIIIGFATLIQT